MHLQSEEPFLRQIAAIVPDGTGSHGFQVFAHDHVPVEGFEDLLVYSLNCETICELLLDFLLLVS
jgi:hypothetical protein